MYLQYRNGTHFIRSVYFVCGYYRCDDELLVAHELALVALAVVEKPPAKGLVDRNVALLRKLFVHLDYATPRNQENIRNCIGKGKVSETSVGKDKKISMGPSVSKGNFTPAFHHIKTRHMENTLSPLARTFTKASISSTVNSGPLPFFFFPSFLGGMMRATTKCLDLDNTW